MVGDAPLVIEDIILKPIYNPFMEAKVDFDSRATTKKTRLRYNFGFSDKVYCIKKSIRVCSKYVYTLGKYSANAADIRKDLYVLAAIPNAEPE